MLRLLRIVQCGTVFYNVSKGYATKLENIVFVVWHSHNFRNLQQLKSIEIGLTSLYSR